MASRSVNSEFIERVVHEVVRRLMQNGIEVTTGESRQVEAELRLTDKVVSLATLEGQLAGVKRVVVNPRAVVTPAAKDELTERAVELVRQ